MTYDTILFPNLGITFAHVGRSFSVGGFEIAYYGIILAIAMISGIYLAMGLAKRTGQNPDEYFNFAILAILLSVLGARLYYVLFSWDYYAAHPLEILNLRGGGLAIYGGVITGVICAAVHCRRKKRSFPQFLDTAMPAVLLGQAIGRWGNFFNREAFGGYTDSLLAMALPAGAVRAEEITDQMQAHLLTVEGAAQSFIQVHPTFLYESLWNLLLLAGLLFLMLTGRKKFHGEIFLLYLLGYGTGRFWIEGLRTDQLLLPGTQLPVSQLLSGILAVAAAVMLVICRRRISRD